MGARRGAAGPRTRALGFPRRGEVHLVAFDPAIGAEIKKTRPALVIQNDVGNRVGAITIVAAVTSNVHEPLYPFEVSLKPPEGGLRKRSAVLLNQVRTIDRSRLLRRLGALRPDTMRKVDRALLISLGLIHV